MPISADRSRWINAVCGLILVGAILYLAFAAPLFGPARGPERFNDYFQMYWFSKTVVETGNYPGFYPYPLPGVLFQNSFGLIGYEASCYLWTFVAAGAALACFWFALDLTGLADHPYRWGIALASFVLVRFYVEWDLKSLNCNLIYLSLVLASLCCLKRSRLGQTAFWIAASIALKVYSGLFLFYFLAKRQVKLLTLAVAWLLLFFVGWPVAKFGPAGAYSVTASWVDQVAGLTAHRYHSEIIPLKSLKRTSQALFHPKTPQAPPGIDGLLAATFIRCGQGLWIALLAGYFLCRSSSPGGPLDLARDASALTIMMLGISPYLETYHGVPTILSTTLFLSIILDARQSKGLRWGLAGLLLSSMLILDFGPNATLRGLGIYSHLVLTMAGLILAKTKLVGESVEQSSDTTSPAVAFKAAA